MSMTDQTTGATTTTTEPTQTTTTTPQPATTPTTDERTFTQADLDRIIDQRLERERKTAEQARAREAQQAEQAQLRAKAEWEELAKQHEESVREMEPRLQTAESERDALREHVTKTMRAQMREWPAEMRDLVPGDDVPIAQRLAAFEKARIAVEKLGAMGAAGNGPGPRRAAGQQNNEQTVETLLRSSGRYSAI
jgi:ATPase subunit of ABC transporter with duplicated ATPase domains